MVHWQQLRFPKNILRAQTKTDAAINRSNYKQPENKFSWHFIRRATIFVQQEFSIMYIRRFSQRHFTTLSFTIYYLFKYGVNGGMHYISNLNSVSVIHIIFLIVIFHLNVNDYSISIYKSSVLREKMTHCVIQMSRIMFFYQEVPVILSHLFQNTLLLFDDWWIKRWIVWTPFKNYISFTWCFYPKRLPISAFSH